MSKNDLRKKVELTFFTLYIHTQEKNRVLPKIWHFPILLFLGFLAHICSRNMVKSVEKRPSLIFLTLYKTKWTLIYFYLIYTYIHKKNSSFALNLTLSNSVIEYKFKLDSPDFYVDDNTRKLSIHWKKLLTLLFFIIVASRSDGCWLAGHTCSDGHISSFIIELKLVFFHSVTSGYLYNYVS